MPLLTLGQVENHLTLLIFNFLTFITVIFPAKCSFWLELLIHFLIKRERKGGREGKRVGEGGWEEKIRNIFLFLYSVGDNDKSQAESF